MQISKARKKAYTEVCEVLNHMTKNDVDKIPNEILTYYSDNSDKKYNFKIDETKTFSEQELSYTAKVVLAILYRDYWATQEEKESIIKKEKEDINNQKQLNSSDAYILNSLDNSAKIATIQDEDEQITNLQNIQNNIEKKSQPVSQIIANINEKKEPNTILIKKNENTFIKIKTTIKNIFKKK